MDELPQLTKGELVGKRCSYEYRGKRDQKSRIMEEKEADY